MALETSGSQSRGFYLKGKKSTVTSVKHQLLAAAPHSERAGSFSPESHGLGGGKSSTKAAEILISTPSLGSIDQNSAGAKQIFAF